MISDYTDGRVSRKRLVVWVVGFFVEVCVAVVFAVIVVLLLTSASLSQTLLTKLGERGLCFNSADKSSAARLINFGDKIFSVVCV